MTTRIPDSVQDAGLKAIAELAADFHAVHMRTLGVIVFARTRGMDDAEIREAFAREGVDFGDLLAALEVRE